MQKGSGFANGKYRIYRQFQKYEDRTKNIDFLKSEYGTGGGTHIFPDGSRGHTWHDSKGIAIDRNGIAEKHDLLLKWTEVEKRLRELIKADRYLNPKEKDHYPEYLKSVSVPQYEVDAQESSELHPLRYLYNEGDVVYIGTDKYEVADIGENAVSLRNPDFPLFGKEFDRADFEEKLRENPANDHLKVVVTEQQKTEPSIEKKPDSIAFSIGFSEHPAFYSKGEDGEFKDRFTNVSFALGNHLLGVLDEKQHREREGNERVGWYHKTDFKIAATVDGEDFNYDGRFDIGDGEGDLLAHIKNFYNYALSPQGEQLYKDDREDLLRGRDELIPFLTQHTELTPEDEKLLAEIMAAEHEWFAPVEEPTEYLEL